MSRYRKVETRMWGDAKFRSLSRLQPSGQALWIWLLTGPQTGIIPGLWSMGEAGMAELLGWNLDAFRDAMREAIREGLAHADFEAPLVWLPNAIRHNSPQSINVVKSWADAWDELPECGLKLTAWKALKAYTEGMSDAFGDAFGKACRMPCAIQEQELEQEKKQKTAPPPTRKVGDSVSHLNSDEQQLRVGEETGPPTTATTPPATRPRAEPKAPRQWRPEDWAVRGLLELREQWAADPATHPANPAGHGKPHPRRGVIDAVSTSIRISELTELPDTGRVEPEGVSEASLTEMCPGCAAEWEPGRVLEYAMYCQRHEQQENRREEQTA